MSAFSALIFVAVVASHGVLAGPKIQLQGAIFKNGQPRPGVEMGPEYIRKGGLVEFLKTEVGADLSDKGDIDMTKMHPDQEKHPKLHRVKEVSTANQQLYDMTKAGFGEGRQVLTIGGDHAISIGTIAAAAETYPDLGILYMDSHADINTPETTGSGNMHGMPLAFVIKEMSDEVKDVKGFDWIKAKVPAKKLAYIGLRSVDPGEKKTMEKHGILAFGLREVDSMGWEKVTKEVLKRIAPTGGPVFFSFDIDVIDEHAIGRNTGTPVEGGLTLREGMSIINEMRKGSKLVGFDMTEVNPALGDPTYNNRTVAYSKYLIGCVFGYCNGGVPELKL